MWSLWNIAAPAPAGPGLAGFWQTYTFGAPIHSTEFLRFSFFLIPLLSPNVTPSLLHAKTHCFAPWFDFFRDPSRLRLLSGDCLLTKRVWAENRSVLKFSSFFNAFPVIRFARPSVPFCNKFVCAFPLLRDTFREDNFNPYEQTFHRHSGTIF